MPTRADLKDRLSKLCRPQNQTVEARVLGDTYYDAPEVGLFHRKNNSNVTVKNNGVIYAGGIGPAYLALNPEGSFQVVADRIAFLGGKFSLSTSKFSWQDHELNPEWLKLADFDPTVEVMLATPDTLVALNAVLETASPGVRPISGKKLFRASSKLRKLLPFF